MSMLPNGRNLLPIGSGGTVTAAPNFNTVATNIVNSKEYVIQGQMYITEEHFNDLDLIAMEPDEIKRKLVVRLVDELFTKNAIEFTKAQDYSQGRTVYRARIYAVPDTMVRILRENGK